MILRSDNPMVRSMVALLAFEVIVFILALPGMLLVDDVATAPAVAVTVVGSVLSVVAAMRARRPWGQVLGWIIQVALIGMGLLTSMMFAVGVVFALIWVMLVVLGRRIENSPGAAQQ